MPGQLQKRIEELASTEAPVRQEAAEDIFHGGKRAAEEATAKWWSDAELARLLLAEAREVTIGLAVGRETFGKVRVANAVAGLAEVPSEQDAEEFTLHFDKGISIDVLTSRAPGGDGAIAKYLSKFGEGIQQVEFRSLDVDRATAILQEKFGVKAVYPETRPGADGTRVNFFLLAQPDGGKILIELYERKATP